MNEQLPAREDQIQGILDPDEDPAGSVELAILADTGLTDEVFAERLLLEERVAVVPGSAFGPSGAGHVRMCYATSYEKLEDALERIGRFVARQRDTPPT